MTPSDVHPACAALVAELLLRQAALLTEVSQHSGQMPDRQQSVRSQGTSHLQISSSARYHRKVLCAQGGSGVRIPGK
jgi:hypothetical protein